MTQDATRSSGGRSTFFRLLGAALLLAGCSTILSLEDGKTQNECTTKAECAPGFGCLKNICRDECTGDADCGSAARCLNAIGVSACIPGDEACDSGNCPDGTACVQNRCRTECDTAAQCAGGQQCLQGLCFGTDAEHDTPPSAGGTGGTSGGSGGSGGAGTGGMSMPGEGGGGAEGTMGGAGGDNGTGITCTPNAPLCIDNRAASCNAQGDGYEGGFQNCTSHQTCKVGACEEHECTPSARFCSGAELRDCASDGLSSVLVDTCGTGTYCDVAKGKCETGVCAPTKPACDGNRATTCNADGSGFAADGVTCNAKQTCQSGKCENQACTPSEVYCENQSVKTCSANGLASSLTDTCVNKTCVEVGATAKCQGDCAPTQRKCSGSQPQKCDPDGSYVADGSACNANGTCDMNTVTCKCNSGYAGNGVTCTKCAAGKYAAAGAASCSTCKAGTYSAAGASSCTPCAAGSYSADGASACTPCAAACSAAAGNYESMACSATTNRVCSVFPSCQGLAANCGGSNDNCCASPSVSGGKVYRGTGTQYQATVATFALDKYEVTVGRFRKFVNAYKGPPANGAGAHPLIANSGWQSPAWDTSIAADSGGLASDVVCDPSTKTWNAKDGINDQLPMNCVSWYEAFAFCAWDAGRLPTEAEWEYAAAGGSNERIYPWGNSPGPTDALNSPALDRANYGCMGDGSAFSSCAATDILAVGSKNAGAGLYTQQDLAGSVWEWGLDGFATFAAPCNNCANLTDVTYRVVRGGGWQDSSSSLQSVSRLDVTPDSHYDIIGFRCAKSAP